jgi:hypothetical protein
MPKHQGLHVAIKLLAVSLVEFTVHQAETSYLIFDCGGREFPLTGGL